MGGEYNQYIGGIIRVEETIFPDVKIIYPEIYKDSRGYFFETYHQKKYFDHGIEANFIQDDQSLSSYGTIRGLHLQTGEHAQAKLVRVIQGKILDIVVDINPKSKLYGRHVAIELNDVTQNQIFIPRGYAHGFAVTSETAVVEYKFDRFYNKQSEGGVIYNDPKLNIDWKIPVPHRIISEKDLKLPSLER